MNEMTPFANRDVCDLIIQDFLTGKEIEYFPYANTTATEVTGDAVYAYGGQGHPKRATFNGDKGGVFTMDTQVQTAKLYSIMSGANIIKTANWLQREELVAGAGGTLTLSKTPIDETVNVYSVSDDCGTTLETSVSGTSVSGSGITEGNTYIAYYQVQLTDVQNVSIKSNTFPKAVKIYADTWDKGIDDEILAKKLIIYKAQPQNNFSISNSNSGDPATLSLKFDLMADGKNNFLDIINA